nr:unnamed protein product [Callosobruchus chinensis]
MKSKEGQFDSSVAFP